MLFFISTLALLGVLFVAFYFLVAKILKSIPSNRHTVPNQQGIDIWVVSNGAHTDIILPLKNHLIDWTQFIDTGNFKDSDFQYVSFGWGDKGFYLETPSWAKLKPKVAFKALFKLSRTTMQVVLYEDVPAPQSKWTKALKVTEVQYQNIIEYIQQSFHYNQNGEIQHIDFAGMPAYEHLNYNFYEANGRYHFLKTCNCWVNDALKAGEIKTATWTPFAKAIFEQLNKFYPEQDMRMRPVVQYIPSRRQRLKNLVRRKIK